MAYVIKIKLKGEPDPHLSFVHFPQWDGPVNKFIESEDYVVIDSDTLEEITEKIETED